jgi:hypothetical protein
VCLFVCLSVCAVAVSMCLHPPVTCNYCVSQPELDGGEATNPTLACHSLLSAVTYIQDPFSLLPIITY